MSHDVPFPLHQDPEISYLCGLLEPTSLLACVKPANAGTPPRWHLFVRPANAAEELWDGARAGVDGAQSFFLAEGAAHALDDAPKVLASELHGGQLHTLFYSAAANPEIDSRLRSTLLAADAGRMDQQPAHRPVQKLRVVKSAAEQQLMRRSGQVGTGAMNATMCGSIGAAAGGLTEGVLAAHFEFESKLAGAERLAYPCVVASGNHATTLHYMHNNAVMRPGEMVLMDAGCNLHGYCSDITRTWPLNGVYSPEQSAVYQAVLEVNEKCIAMCVADGTTSLRTLHREALQLTFSALLELGLVRRDDPNVGKRVQRYFPHAIGHWLGIDVHDTPSIDSSLPLEPGMAITIEPGIYLPADDETLPSWARGIGIRIEDDLVVRAPGEAAEVLTAASPKRIDEVEAMLSGSGAGMGGGAEAGAAATANA
jgi:Xaa-Pro aminopeptidase